MSQINRDTIPEGADFSKEIMIRYLEDEAESIISHSNSFGSPDQQEILFTFCLKTLIWLRTGITSDWVTDPHIRFCKRVKILPNVPICDQLKQYELVPAFKSMLKDYKENYK